MQLHLAARAHHDEMRRRMQLLKKFYLSVAATPPETPEEAIVIDEEDDLLVGDLLLTPLPDQLGLSWRSCLYSQPASKRVDLDFCASMLQQCIAWQTNEAISVTVSLVEVVFLFLKEGLHFPFWDDSHGWHLRHVQSCFERPTLATLLTVVKSSLRFCIDRLGLAPFVCGLDRTILGIVFPVDGIALCLEPELLLTAQRSLRTFCGRRPLRKACDLARPV